MSVEFVAGVDGGGTKTEYIFADAAGNILARGILGSLNFNSSPHAHVVETVRALCACIRDFDGICRMLCIGSAGTSNPSLHDTFERELRAAGYAGEYRLVGDQTIALAAAFGDDAGVMLESGTGSICLGRDAAGNTVRIGGRGFKIDDGGSAYAIGRDILAAVAHAEDGRAAPTVLSELVFARLGTHDIDALIREIYAPQVRQAEIAAYASLLPEALERGDAAAARILEDAAAALALLASTAIARLKLESGRVALFGGTLAHNPHLAAAVAARIQAAHPAFTVALADAVPAMGAVYLALHAQD